MKKVYISGRINGLDPAEVERKFYEAECHLAEMGFEPINPLRLAEQRKSATWGGHIISDLKVLQRCDSIYMIDNWNNSIGANIEWLFAVGEGIPEYPRMRRWNARD